MKAKKIFMGIVFAVLVIIWFEGIQSFWWEHNYYLWMFSYNIYHTFVDDSMRWHGIGSELVEKAINHLTSKWYKVSATCSYARKSLK